MWLGFEEEGFFSREELTEYIDEPLSDMFKADFGVSSAFRSYVSEDDDKVLETDCNINDNQFMVTTKIDFRAIKKPSDLGKSAYKIYRQIVEDYWDYLGIA